MKKILLVLMAAFAFTACGSDDFWERFGPEVLFYQGAEVVTADFIAVTLDPGQTEYQVKARCSAPNDLTRIEVFRDGASIRVIADFDDATKNQYFLNETVTGTVSETEGKATSTDKDGKTFSKTLTISVN